MPYGDRKEVESEAAQGRDEGENEFVRDTIAYKAVRRETTGELSSTCFERGSDEF